MNDLIHDGIAHSVKNGFTESKHVTIPELWK